ncbi:hypothetical protein IAI10_20000 [Clostridium sp. 19966]|uniref:hypothetical protein n=1 Tax=Clostridium sp. 19966 TaxID=2768166 RepID=UPI0028DF797A|nr:hypothetical protein [Clostridium sp. 19966]MDT8718939.1 hypothetical protein [Clostridium sp. 19966]
MKKNISAIIIIFTLILFLGSYELAYIVKNKNIVSPNKAISNMGKYKNEVFGNLDIKEGIDIKWYRSDSGITTYVYDYPQNVMGRNFSKVYISFKNEKMSQIIYENTYKMQWDKAAYIFIMSMYSALVEKYGQSLNDKVQGKESFMEETKNFFSAETKGDTGFLTEKYWSIGSKLFVALKSEYDPSDNRIKVWLMYVGG